MYEIIMSRVGVDQAVRMLEGKPYMKKSFTYAKVLTQDNFDSVPAHILQAPADWDLSLQRGIADKTVTACPQGSSCDEQRLGHGVGARVVVRSGPPAWPH